MKLPLFRKYLRWQQAKLEARQWVMHDGIRAAAEAMFSLNRYLRANPRASQKEIIYAHKNAFVEWLFKNGYCTAVAREVQKFGCWNCEGSGTHWTGEECFKCSGSGIHHTVDIYSFRFSISGRRYSWHQPARLVPWLNWENDSLFSTDEVEAFHSPAPVAGEIYTSGRIAVLIAAVNVFLTQQHIVVLTHLLEDSPLTCFATDLDVTHRLEDAEAWLADLLLGHDWHDDEGGYACSRCGVDCVCQGDSCIETANVKCYEPEVNWDWKSAFQRAWELARHYPREAVGVLWQKLTKGHFDTYAYYCSQHATENGYCYGCGEFWAGVETFDFSPSGLCSNCLSAEDDGDFDYESEDEEDEWDEVPF